jgi:Ni/Fe-hydrogenase subunit HybB-like protein
MSIITKIREQNFPVTYWVLAALVVLGMVLGVTRLVLGLGATTNLSTGYPWGLWITFDVFSVPFSAGAFTLAAVLHIFNRKRYHSVAHVALLAGFLGYLLVVLVLLMDLGRWDQFYSVLMPWRWNLHSFMFEVSMSITIYFGVLVLELVGVVFGDRDWLPVRLINQVIPLIAGTGVLLSCVHQGSLGALFLVLSHKLHPLWWTPILPVLFLTSALFSGLSVAIFLAILTWRALGRPAPMQLLRGLAKVVLVLQTIYLVLKVGDLLLAGEAGLVFGSGILSVLFLAEMVIGLVMPLIMFASRARESETGLLVGVVYTLVGLALNRSSIAWFALSAPADATYFPHWMEFGILIAAVSFGILFFTLGVRYIPALRGSVLEEEYGKG